MKIRIEVDCVRIDGRNLDRETVAEALAQEVESARSFEAEGSLYEILEAKPVKG